MISPLAYVDSKRKRSGKNVTIHPFAYIDKKRGDRG